LIREHGDIETILKNLDRKKYSVPRDWVPNETTSEENGNDTTDEEDEISNKEKAAEKENLGDDANQILPAFVQARELFHNHEVTTDVELKWTEPQSAELSKYLIEEHGFNPERVAANIQKLEAAYKANRKPQARMDSFFAVKADPAADAKRKKRLEDEKAGSKKQKTTNSRNTKGKGKK
jgi:hypothetical protein